MMGHHIDNSLIILEKYSRSSLHSSCKFYVKWSLFQNFKKFSNNNNMCSHCLYNFPAYSYPPFYLFIFTINDVGY